MSLGLFPHVFPALTLINLQGNLVVDFPDPRVDFFFRKELQLLYFCRTGLIEFQFLHYELILEFFHPCCLLFHDIFNFELEESLFLSLDALTLGLEA